MDRRLRSGQVVLGLGLVAVAVLAVDALRRSAALPLRPAPPAEVAAPMTLAGLTPLQAPDPPGSGQLPAPTCRVVGHLAVAPAGADTIWGAITNVGAISTTLDGVEIGWAGDATLRAIVARVGPGETERVLFDGKAASPFYATLDGGWRLAPGEAAQIGFRFDWANPDAPWLLQAAVLHLRGGCRTVLRVPLQGPACPVRITDRPHVPSSARNRVEVTVENTGAKDDYLTAIEVAWPVATNGRLMAVALDGQTVVDLREGFSASPATLPLARMRADGIAIAPGKLQALGLVFERPAAADGYSIQATTRRGCALSATTGLAAWDCGVGSGDVVIDGDVARFKLTNPRDIDRTVTDLTLFWPAVANGPLVGVTVDGQSAYRGEKDVSPVSVPLAAPIRLPAGGSVELAFRFRPPAAAGSGPQLAAGAYTLVVGLDGGCETVFTNRAAVGACDLSAGELVSLVEPARHNMQVDLVNNGDDVRLAALHLSWPAANGEVRAIRLAGVDLLAGPPLAHASEGVTVTVPSGAAALVPQGGRATLAVDFAEAPLPDGYAFALRFVNRRDEPCQTVLVTRQADPGRGIAAPCAGALVGPRYGADRATFELEVTNHGPSPSGLAGLDINVAQFDPLEPLNTIEAVRAGGEVQSLWANLPLRRPPYLVRLPEPFALAAGETATLRLHFLPTFRPNGPAEDVLTVRALFADGCAVWNVPIGAEPPPSMLLSGVVAALPDPLQSCCWRIRRWDNDAANREVSVDVDANTVIEPASVTPRVGDPVNITAVGRADGSTYAERIVFQRRGVQVKVAGPIDKLGPPSATRPGLPEWFVVQGRLVSIVDSTTVNGEPALGGTVFVVGAPNGGMIVAETIDVVGAAVRELLSRKAVEGLVVSTSGSGDDRIWVVANTRVHVTAQTRFFDADNQPLANPPLPAHGTPLRVEGALEGGGQNDGAPSLRADSVWYLPTQATREVRGTLVQLPPAGQVGEWKVDVPGVGAVSFVVRSLAVVDTRLAPAQTGLGVTALLRQSEDGSWVALKLRTDWGAR